MEDRKKKKDKKTQAHPNNGCILCSLSEFTNKPLVVSIFFDSWTNKIGLGLPMSGTTRF